MTLKVVRTSLCLLVLTSSLVLTACSSETSEAEGNKGDSVAKQTQATRVVEHARGKTEVPINPQRVVALDNIALDSMLALGVTPVAALYNEHTEKFPVHLRDHLQGKDVKRLSPTRASIEAITNLNPDLVIGGKNVERVYDLLSRVAPTILLGESGTSDWKEKLKLSAEALGKPEAAEKLLQDYRDHLAKLRAQLGKKADKLEVSVIRVFPQGIRLYQKDSFAGQILEDAGLSRPPAQNEDRLWTKISKERLDAADGDVIFVWTLGNESESALKKLRSDPLWSQLSAVQEGRVYEVPGYWIGRGPIAANAVIDDLFKYLVKEKNGKSEE
ncbi:MAG: iron-siderophore ABC transporter substrate-binding protein [Cyanobacteria bacterium QS_5_48_63]|nr:MAG: iron-siderophore ABC transporter substrate-binding protein [Cyanobacteria bacterium QS_5_48_63]